MSRQKQIADRMAEIRSELLRLERVERSGRVSDPDEHDRQVVALTDEFDALDRESREWIARLASDPGNTEPGDGAAPMPGEAPYFNRNLDPYVNGGRETAEETRGRALNAVEGWRADDGIKEAATRTIERAGFGTAEAEGEADASGVARHVLRYGNPLYQSAFRKWVKDPEGYVADLTPQEAQAWRDARAENRATLQLSGAVVPSPLDPTISLTSDGSVSPLRQIARVDSTSSKHKRYITSPGASFGFYAELATVDDDTPTLSEVTITPERASGFIAASIEALADQVDWSTEMVKIIGDAKDNLEAEKFTDGTGSDEPYGIAYRLANTTTAQVAPTSAETFALADVYKVAQALPARWRPRASWMAELSTLNHAAQFESGNGARMFPRLDDMEPSMLRRRVYENSYMDAHSDILTGSTGTHDVLAFGDFDQFVILDRIGMAVEVVPHIFDVTNNRPIGARGFFAYWRTGSDWLTSNAFKALHIETTP